MRPAEHVLHAEDIFGADAADDVLTEAGAAERFTRRHGDTLRFDHRRHSCSCATPIGGDLMPTRPYIGWRSILRGSGSRKPSPQLPTATGANVSSSSR